MYKNAAYPQATIVRRYKLLICHRHHYTPVPDSDHAACFDPHLVCYAVISYHTPSRPKWH